MKKAQTYITRWPWVQLVMGAIGVLSLIGLCLKTTTFMTNLSPAISLSHSQVTAQNITPFSLVINPGILDEDNAPKPCPPFEKPRGTEEAQMDIIWGELFKDVGVQSVSKIAAIYDKSHLSYLPLTFINKTSGLGVQSSKDYNYTMNTPTASHTHVCMQVQEFRKHRTLGGSNFQMIIRGRSSIDVTRSIDYHNGSYLLCAKHFEPKVLILVNVYYQGYDAFVHSCAAHAEGLKRLFSKEVFIKKKPNGEVLIKDISDLDVQNKNISLGDLLTVTKINTKQTQKHSTLIERYVKSHEVCDILHPDNSRWVIYQNQWRLLYKDHVVANANPMRINRCLMEYDSVTIVGDSHLRNLYKYFMTFVPAPDLTWTKERHTDLRGGHLSFFWRPRGREFNNYLESLRQDLLDNTWSRLNFHRKRKRGHVILMNSGHHDFEYPGGPSLFITNQKRTVALIKDLVVIARTKNVQLVWITHPPFMFELSLDKSCRNNFQLAAAHQWLLPLMIETGISVINIFDLTYVLNDVNVCIGHYLCVKSIHQITGDPGRTMANLILTQICPEREL